jgi:hypothetical protein
VFWILILGITLCAVFYMILLRTTSAINKEDSAWLKGMLKGS